MTKLVIQIPCFNERETLEATIGALPKRLPGVDEIELLVIDDGSTDATAELARELGVNHVVKLNAHRGLAHAFMTGLTAALKAGADVIVNTDGDNQYAGADVGRIVEPVLESEADICVGARPINDVEHFSKLNKLLHHAGNWLVRRASGTRVADATSGFRAFSRDAALRLSVHSSFSYTLETLIQAGASGLRVTSVPIRVNPPTRPSRLARGMLHFVARSMLTIISTFLLYQPTRFFLTLAAAFFLPGVILAGRYLLLAALGEGAGHVQSVIAAGVLAVFTVVLVSVGILAHLLAVNRRLLDEVRYYERKRLFDAQAELSAEEPEDASLHWSEVLR